MNRHLMDILLGKTTMQPGPSLPPGSQRSSLSTSCKPRDRPGKEAAQRQKDRDYPRLWHGLSRRNCRSSSLVSSWKAGAEVLRYSPCGRAHAWPYECALAEVDVPYEKLCELDVFAFLEGADVAIVGANDVVNPRPLNCLIRPSRHAHCPG